MTRTFILSLVLLPTIRAYAQDPAAMTAAALREARTHIAAKEFVEAVKVLEPAFATASTIPDATERDQALAALHFYSAVGDSGTGNDRSAREHLTQFFRLSPNARRIDPAKYDRHFVALFNELMPPRAAVTADTFETYYPAPGSLPVSESPPLPEGAWGDSPALEILASAAEKREWSSLTSSADRARFIADFWRRRDPAAATPNEFRETFERRVAYADNVFGTSEERGSLSDRGRVFVLLGRPSFVRRRPISREDLTGRNRVWIATDAIINGTIEQWAYTREQLPIRLSKQSITYRFVTQAGIGVGVLQKEDAYAMQALEAAMNPNLKH